MIQKANLQEMREFIGRALFSGYWHVVHRDKMGRIIEEEYFKNLITNEGLDYLLNAGVHGDTQISAWYFAPFTAAHTPAAGDTYATPGYTEATTEYSESTRQEWAEGASSGQSITNSTAATITAAASVTIYGAGIVGGGTGATTKGDTAGGGTLLASGQFSASKTLASGETLDLTYTLSGASS